MIDLIVFVSLLALGYGFGRRAEASHFKSIIEREQQMKGVLTFNERTLPTGLPPVSTVLVGGNVVIAVDYFKRFVAGLRGLVGGRLSAYESLLERARREALLRMKKEAQALGANMIINVKLETASISKGRKRQIGSVEVYAYGTALVPNAE